MAPTTPDLWRRPLPSQDSDFLQLHYENQYGSPDGATSNLYQHPFSQPDYVGMAAEVEIARASDDGFRVRLIGYSWQAMASGCSPSIFERMNGCSVTVWDSHDTFGSFYDAEAFALFAWSRWRATGSGGRAGMKRRDDLDNLLNPVEVESYWSTVMV
jgi:hypothetical protein